MDMISYSDGFEYFVLAVSVVAAFGTVLEALRHEELRVAIKNLFKTREVGDLKYTYMKVLSCMFDAALPKGRVFRTILIIANASLAMSMAKLAEQAAAANENAKKSKTIVGLMLGEKMKQSTRIQLILLSVLIVNALFAYINDSDINVFVILVVVVGWVAIYVDHKLIEYRVTKGWYGKNEFESREIIRFIISHANKDDFNDRGGLKRVIPEPSLVGGGELETLQSGGVQA